MSNEVKGLISDLKERNLFDDSIIIVTADHGYPDRERGLVSDGWDLVKAGLQHDLMQYFGVLENLPLNVSVLAAYTNMKVDYNIDDDDIYDNVNATNGKAEFKMNTFTVQALASLDFKIISVYAGLGYNSGQSETNLKGDYELSYDVEDEFGTVVGTVSETVSDPINLDFEANGMRATIGTRLNLGIFKIFGDYTIQEYNTASLGIAFSFR